MKLQPIRGTRDLIGDDIRIFRQIEETFSQLACVYDFQEIETPILESTAVFSRSLGEASDIVNKEMYTFERSGESLTLRPEGTAPVARAVISNGLQRDMPLKLFYRGPMFRYERPQKGRYRQFYQFGVELLGVPGPLADVEVLAMANQLFAELGLSHQVQLEINTLGDLDSRHAYRQQLLHYFSEHKSQLSEESLHRLAKNPLRILDSKDEGDQKLVAQAPLFADFLNPASSQFFADVQTMLKDLGIAFICNDRLVRGLDYYSHTVWEFTTNALGAQNAVLSGGRYDNLLSAMGGQELPGVGWAAGTDRLAMLLGQPRPAPPSVGIIVMTETAAHPALQILQELRKAKIPAQTFYSGNPAKQIKKADKRGCAVILMIGDDELNSGLITLKNLATGQQNAIPREQLVTSLTYLAVTGGPLQPGPHPRDRVAKDSE